MHPLPPQKKQQTKHKTQRQLKTSLPLDLNQQICLEVLTLKPHCNMCKGSFGHSSSFW